MRTPNTNIPPSLLKTDPFNQRKKRDHLRCFSIGQITTEPEKEGYIIIEPDQKVQYCTIFLNWINDKDAETRSKEKALILPENHVLILPHRTTDEMGKKNSRQTSFQELRFVRITPFVNHSKGWVPYLLSIILCHK